MPSQGGNLLRGRSLSFEVKCPGRTVYFEVKCPGDSLLRSNWPPGHYTSGGKLLRDRPIAIVPCLHEGKVYSKRKLRVWRSQKCNPLVGAKTPLTCESWLTTTLMGSGVGPRTETCVNWGGLIAMVLRLHQGYVYRKRKLRVWSAQKCNSLV